MPKIEINRERCNNCGLCARDCASGTLQVVEDEVRVEEPTWCNLCSHCVAVCPQDAVIHEGLSGSESRRIDRDRTDAECYREVVMARRSVRHFKDEPVDRDEIEEILDLARYSPTASNTMDVGYVVITDRELIDKVGEKIFRQGEKFAAFLEKPAGKVVKKLFGNNNTLKGILRYADRIDTFKEWVASGRNPVTHKAPAMIIIHGPEKGRFVPENAAIAAANITNYAHARGLGTCYLGLVVVPAERSEKLSRRLGVPEGRKICMALALGRPAYRYRNTPIRPAPDVTWIE